MLEAERLWQLRPRRLAHIMRFQFAFARVPTEAWYLNFQEVAGGHLGVGCDLPITRVQDRDGRPLGLMLGIAVGPTTLLETTAVLPFSAADREFWRQFEAFLNECAGRFAFVLEHDGQARLYTDPVGMIGAVYDAEAHRFASSVHLALTRPVEANPLYSAPILDGIETRYGIFHTCDAHVKRLNPSYYLDLNTFEPHRFWPRDEVFSLDGTTHAETYDEIIARLRFNTRAIVSAYPCALPLSGGRDSRILASVASESLGDIRLCYTHVKNWASSVDAHIGAAVASSLGVAHSVFGKLKEVRSERWERNLLNHAFEITHGSRTAPPQEYQNGLLGEVPSDYVILRGHQTDFLRAVFVFRPKPEWSDPLWQIERMLLVPRDAFTPEIGAHFAKDFMDWQATLPPNAMEKAADFMFLEVYYNSSLGALFPALWQHFYLSPFNSRRLIELSLRFDEEERRQGFPVYDIIQKTAPACAAVPFFQESAEPFADLSIPDLYGEVAKARFADTQARLERYYENASLAAE